MYLLDTSNFVDLLGELISCTLALSIGLAIGADGQKGLEFFGELINNGGGNGDGSNSGGFNDKRLQCMLERG